MRRLSALYRHLGPFLAGFLLGTLTGVKQFTRAAFVIFFFVFTASLAWAWPPTYGPEFEFTNAVLTISHVNSRTSQKANSPERKAYTEMAESLKAQCPQLHCTVEEVNGKWGVDFKVTFEDGWYFKISFDPAVIEVTFKPSTLQEIESRKELINTAIFKSAQNLGYYVNSADGAGHFNIGIRSAFQDSPENFVRFFVDYANHADLALGGLAMDLENAPPLSVLKNSQRAALQKIIERTQLGEFHNLKDVTLEIQNKVYTHTYDPDWGSSEHYQAVGLKNINKADMVHGDAPMELRAIRSQRNADEFILMSRLFEARINYLNAHKGQPIIYTQNSRTTYSPRELRTRFYIYVAELGLDFSEFKSLQPRGLQSQEPDPLVSDANVPKALESVERYWDLMLTSEWMRNHVLDLLASPESLTAPHREVILRRIESEAMAEYLPAQTRRTWKNLYGLVKDRNPQITEAEHQVRQVLWKDVFQRTQIPRPAAQCRKVLLQSL